MPTLLYSFAARMRTQRRRLRANCAQFDAELVAELLRGSQQRLSIAQGRGGPLGGWSGLPLPVRPGRGTSIVRPSRPLGHLAASPTGEFAQQHGAEFFEAGGRVVKGRKHVPAVVTVEHRGGPSRAGGAVDGLGGVLSAVAL